MDDETRTKIETAVKTNRVLLFMKGNRSFPQCGFSATVVSILNQLGPRYETINVLAEPAIRDGIKEYSQWPTIPQLYVDGQLVGGCDIVKSLHASGELAKLVGVEAPRSAAPAITLSPSAAHAFDAAAADAGGDQVLRLSANERFQYELFFGDKAAGDVIVSSQGRAIHVDGKSAALVDGLSIDFVDGPDGGGFRITHPNQPARVKPLTPAGLKAMLDQGEKIELFDVRTPEERTRASLPGARLLDQPAQAYLLGLDRATPIVFHCHHGGRSRAAAEHFVKQGFQNVYNLEGGIDAWSQTIDPSIPRY
jgi:monothiol glutaredoxin